MYKLIISNSVINQKIKELTVDGNVLIFSKEEYDSNGDIIHSQFDDIIYMEKLGYIYINTILVPSNYKGKEILADSVRPVLWFVKDINSYYFNKDAIREKHIWKDVEWGKREKNYNPLGKDPGNVWIPTIDDGHAKIIDHIVLTQEDIINRFISAFTNGVEKIFISFNHLKINELNSNSLIEYEENSNDDWHDFSCYPIEKVNTYNIKNSVYFQSSEFMDNISFKCNLMVTSPPYWNIKNYFKEGQIGQESYNDYLKRLNNVWIETYNHLEDYGTIWININTIFKNKRVVLIPRDIVEQCKHIGFHFKKIVYWHKSSGIPTNSKNLSDHFEYILVFSKNEKCEMNSINYNYYKNDYFSNSNVWNINRKAGIIGKNYVHPAVYPNELIDLIIRLSCPNNGIVLDPFLGSGTTLVSAINSGVKCVSFEYNEDFYDLIKYRVSNEAKAEQIDYFIGEKKHNKIFRN